MKKALLALFLLTLPTVAFAQMDSMTYRTERDALAKTVALQEECQIEVNTDALMEFIPQHFEGYESRLLSELDAMVSLAKINTNKATGLQKKLLCSTAQKYITMHKLGLSN